MSVLIRGMKIPAKCKDCDLVDAYQMQCPLMPGVVSLYKEFSDAIQENRRSKYCPLIHIPPHGRLGDLDAAVEKLKRLREFHADDSRSAPFIVAGISQCIDILSGREAPTIIPAELPKEETE